MKTLGICIPTYKRPDFLRRCVLSAVASAEGLPIRIFIADDATSDTNERVIAELQAAHPFVHARGNPVNLGIDANIQQAVAFCDCDYAWLIGEDDTFLPGAVARMHERLQTLDAIFVFTNYTFVGNEPTLRLGEALQGVGDGAMEAERFLSYHLWAVGFLGACVVHRTAWLRTDPAPYAGTYYTHVGRIAEMVADAGSAHVVADCSVANRVEGGQDTFTWKNDSYGVFFGFLTMCRVAGSRRPAFASTLHRAGETFERRYRWLSLRLAVRLRSELAYDYGQYRKYLRDCSLSAPKKLAMLCISVVPPVMFRPLVRMYRAGRRKD